MTATTPSPPPTERTLAALGVGECVRITGLGSADVPATAAGDADLMRLRALGLCEGRHAQILKAGDPLIVRVFGTRLGVARSLASRVTTEPCDAARCREREAVA